jgi:uncharacterized membrane protein
MVVHFPLALTLTATGCLVAARFVRAQWSATLATVGTWNLCLGAVAVLFALMSGMGAVLHLDVSAAAHQAISLHVKWAIFTSLALLLVAVWRGAGTVQDSRPTMLFLLILLCVTGALVMTGYHGGENVYVYAIGVQH